MPQVSRLPVLQPQVRASLLVRVSLREPALPRTRASLLVRLSLWEPALPQVRAPRRELALTKATRPPQDLGQETPSARPPRAQHLPRAQ